jgi:hypothetical protein
MEAAGQVAGGELLGGPHIEQQGRLVALQFLLERAGSDQHRYWM